MHPSQPLYPEQIRKLAATRPNRRETHHDEMAAETKQHMTSAKLRPAHLDALIVSTNANLGESQDQVNRVFRANGRPSAGHLIGRDAVIPATLLS